VDSPACIVVGEHDMSANLARVLKAVGQDAPDHEADPGGQPRPPAGQAPGVRDRHGKFDDLGMILLDQAQLAEGGQLDDPAAFVGRLNKLMMNMFMSGG
jgi:molecular chaperone HtpG